MKTVSLALAVFLLAAPAFGDDLTVPMPEGTKVQRVKTSYVCAGLGALTVEYVTAGDVSLALLPVDSQPLVFANVLSGSGVRYAAGPYVWWSKGNTAALYDVRKGEKAEPVQCQQKQ